MRTKIETGKCEHCDKETMIKKQNLPPACVSCLQALIQNMTSQELIDCLMREEVKR